MYENNIAQHLKNAEVIAVSGHLNPDGDAVGSVLAFAQMLDAMGKKPIVLIEDFDEKFNIIKGTEYIYKGDYNNINPDIFFALDCGSIDRLRNAEPVFKRSKLTYNIDHHQSNTNFADINIVNGTASSASEIAYEIISKMTDINKDIATAIYIGILTDTGGFMYNSTSQRTHQIAGELVSAGIDTPFIHAKILCQHTLPQARLMGVAMGNMQIDEGCIASTTISKVEMSICGAAQSDLDGIAEYMLNTKGIEVAVLCTERDNGFTKLSFRSKKIDVSQIAQELGGGGHKLAAGVGFVSPLYDAQRLAIEKLREKLNNENGNK